MSPPLVVGAVDWGATSIRVCRVSFTDDQPPSIEVVHRVGHRPVIDAGGTARWEFERLIAETERGLDLLLDRGPVASIGVDTWGVDYGLIGSDGELVAAPVSYRDRRTDGYRAVLESIGAERLFSICGLQILPFNTIFQLAAHDRTELHAARRIALLPDLVVERLGGEPGAERTMAGTTGLLDVTTRTWSAELCEAIDVPVSLFAPVVEPGTVAGRWRGIPVVRVGAHDTASAVLGGAPPGAAFVATGTWLLVGDQRAEPDLRDAARQFNMTNEQGVDGGLRLLTNVAGFWLIEECARHWGVSASDVVAMAAEVAPGGPLLDARDPALLAPADMPASICELSGMADDATRGEIARCAIESMAAGAGAVLAWLGAAQVSVFGGASQAGVLIDALRRHTSATVMVGAAEATALGNALVQAVHAGWYADVPTAQARLAASVNGSSAALPWQGA